MSSKVYFTNFRSVGDESIPEKLQRLIREAGIETIDMKDRFVAVKLHFGEDGNTAYLRPNYAKAVVDVIRGQGGKPFVTDCSTLYVGHRKNAVDHLALAYEHGYNPFCVGCPTIIGDGLKGEDDIAVPIDGEYVQSAKIGRVVMDADVFVSLTHFKAHEGTGIGGTLKNIGMGCGSGSGKAEMHSTEKPEVIAEKCVGCGTCAKNCAHNGIRVENGRAKVYFDFCKGCGRCIGVCPEKALRPGAENGCEILARKVTEYAYAVCKGRPCFHISLVMDVTPFCDCYGQSDASVVPDVGMFASFDPVALDKACADAVLSQTPNAGSFLTDRPKRIRDHFRRMHPDTKWEAGIEQGVKIGLGSDQYDLIEI